MPPTQVRQEQLRGGSSEYENLKVELADLRSLINGVVAASSDTASSSDIVAINIRIDSLEGIVNNLISQASDASISIDYLISYSSDSSINIDYLLSESSDIAANINYLIVQSSDFSEFIYEQTTPQGLAISYDVQGQISSVSFDDGREILVIYDGSGNIDQVVTSDYAKQFTYSSDGNLVAVTIV